MRAFLIAVSVMCVTVPAWAQVRTLAQFGIWNAFGGVGNQGLPTCGVDSINTALGQHFIIQYNAGDNAVLMRVHRLSWRVPTNAVVRVRLVVDGAAWNAEAIPAQNATAINGRFENTGLRWTVSGETLREFSAAFRRGSVMTIQFPEGNEAPWVFDLRGTNAVMNAFLGCLQTLMPSSTQPHGQRTVPSAPPPAAPTQPFSPTPSRTEPLVERRT